MPLRPALRAAALACAALLAAPAAADPPTVWAEAVQPLYDPVARRVERVRVRVADPHPEMALAFRWEPAAGNWPGVDAEGRAEGPGRLSWRVPGTADYDPRAVHHSFAGVLRAGRFDGPGVLRYRSGERLEGQWRAGRLHGPGRHMQADGTLYEGDFVDGVRQGAGVLRARGGWIWEGGFAGGAMHGAGVLHLPGGLRQPAVFEHGRAAADSLPPLPAGMPALPPLPGLPDLPPLPDRLLGGLLPAQGGAEAERTTLTVVSDLRMSQLQDLRYTHQLLPDRLVLQLDHPRLAEIWVGTAAIGPSGFLRAPDSPGRTAELAEREAFFEVLDAHWLETELVHAANYTDFHAFLDARLSVATGGAPVRLAGVQLEVARSIPHLRPIPGLFSQLGCVGYRPEFVLANIGWGAVEAAEARFAALNPETGAAAPGEYRLSLGGFDRSLRVDLEPLLRAAGIDPQALADDRYDCPPGIDRADCLAAFLRDRPVFGRLAPAIGVVEDDLGYGTVPVGVRLEGELALQWRDAEGLQQVQRQPVAALVSLAGLRIGAPGAEMGAGGAFAAEAPAFIEVRLPAEGRDYAIDLPIRGNPRVRDFSLPLKFISDRSSIHDMRLALRMSDGSVRYSLPMTLYYYRPREMDWDAVYPPINWDDCWF